MMKQIKERRNIGAPPQGCGLSAPVAYAVQLDEPVTIWTNA